MSLYGLIIGIAILIGIAYFERHQKIIPDKKLPFFEFGLIISAIIGARVYHVIDQWNYYSQNLWLIPQTWHGGLGIFGALIGGSIFIVLFLNLKSYFLVLDSIAPILPLCQAIGRLGNWVNGENPVWWLEALGNLVLFLTIQIFPNKPLAKYLVGYGLIRFATEFWRNDTWEISHTKVGQIIAIIFLAFGLFLWIKRTPPVPFTKSTKH